MVTAGALPLCIFQIWVAMLLYRKALSQPAGAHAANLVGFSTQVLGRIIFLTEGASKKVKIGNQEILFKKDYKEKHASCWH